MCTNDFICTLTLQKNTEMNYLKFVLFTLVFLGLGCSDGFEPIPFSSELELPSKYNYELTISCFCLTTYVGPHKIFVENETIVDYQLLSDDEIDENIDLTQFTIASLVDRVNEFITQDPITQDIEVHPKYGFPLKVYFDVDERIADEEWGYEISNFVVEKE